MALAGRNGSGKTTLLRILAGEIAADAGTVATAKGARVALHDQRPPRDAATLRDHVAGGLAWIAEIEAELERLERLMADGVADEATLTAYSDAQGRLEHAGGYRWRDGVAATLGGLGFADEELDRPLRLALGRRADQGLARPRDRLGPRPAAARRADQPPRHRLARVA